jgi:hypothetical protein
MIYVMPSGPGSPLSPELDKVMALAFDHGYRVGLQLGDHGRVVVHVRDIAGDQKVIAILGEDSEDCARRLMIEMLKRGYVPRGSLSTMGGG